MKTGIKITLGLLISIFLLAGFQNTQAQVTFPVNPVSTVLVNVSPKNPRPGDKVTVKVESSLIDLNRSSIGWYVDRKLVSSGVGNKSYTFTAGPVGTSINLVATVITPDDREIVKSIPIVISAVDLVWEALSYTPHFYKGKAQYPIQGALRIVALPQFSKNGGLVDPRTLIYTWTHNSGVVGSASGYGKDSFVIEGDYGLRPIEVSVSVTNSDQSMTATNYLTLAPTSARTLLYEDSPLYGTLFNRALSGNYILDKEEMRLIAVPYFFSGPTPHQALVRHTWSMNGRVTSNTNPTGNTIVLRRPEESGRATIAVSTAPIDNESLKLQYSTASIGLGFNAQQ